MSDWETLHILKKELEQEFHENLFPYWTRFSIDEKNGGFVGRVTFDNQKIYQADKGGILNARLLWAFSAAYKTFHNPQIEEAAHRAYNYFKEHFIDNNYGGFYWMLDYKGESIDDKKHIYTQAFGVYGLVEYYSAFKNQEALKLAYNIYSLIEKNAIDKTNGGYFEAYTRDWKLCDDVRLSEKDENEPKSMNTHLHVLEAYTSLYRHAPNKELGKRLESLIQYFCNHIINKEKTHLITFFDLDWSPRSEEISFGHDIETSWLLVEAAESLGNEQILQKTKKYALSIAYAVLEKGVDQDGGLINEAGPSGITDSDKDWWPQAEAIIGFLNAFEISGDTKFLNAALNSWEFIKKYIIDRKHGEWYEKVTKAGVPYPKMDKVRLWKGPYHNVRAVLEVITRVERLSEKNQFFSEKLN